MIINQQNLTSLFTSYSVAFKNAFKEAETDWQKIATMVPSATKTNLYAWLGQFPQFREWLGSRIVKNMAAFDYSLVNKKFESTVGVPADDIKDDVHGVFSTIFQAMGYSAKRHPDELVFALLALGATELCYDGQPFFNASHPIITDGVAGTTSNYTAAGGNNLWILMDTKRPLKPMIWQKREDYTFQTFTNMQDEHVFKNDEYLYGARGRSVAGYGLWQMAYGSNATLNGTNFDAHVTSMMSLKSDEGKPLGIKPDLLVCGPSNRAAARNLLMKELGTAGETNPNFKEVDLLVTPELA